MRVRSLALLLVAIFSLPASWLAARLVDAQRPRSDAPPPPEVAVPSVLLGAFRGLVVDYLWLRACRLEEEGKFYEAKDLAEWISKLEPRLEQVWSFQAHGLAYNLCAASDDPADRWKWIQEGVKLLRDDGIRINPRAPELYFMLARIYSDKIGGPFDDWHLYLKKRLAVDLVRAFGPLGEDSDLEGLAHAPSELDAEAAVLLEKLTAAGLDLHATDGGWDEALSKAPRTRELAKQASPDVVRSLRCFFRAQCARRLGLDPSKCLEVEQRYGPLDWRGCDAISLYWAVQGVHAAETLGPLRAAKEGRKLERVAIQDLKHAVRRGRLILEPSGDVFFAPEPRLVAKLLSVYDDAVERARAAEKAGEKVAEDEADDDGHEHERPKEDLTAGLYRMSMEEARADFLSEAVLILARYGRDAEARRAYARLNATHATGRTYDEFLSYTLELEATSDFGSQVTAYQIIGGNWFHAWIALARGDDQEALGRIALADRAHREWQKVVNKHRAEGDLQAVQRLGTVELGKIKKDSLEAARARLSPALRKRLDERAPALMGEK